MKKGYTLIELLVAISIIGILSSIAMVSLTDAKLKANDAKRKADIYQVRTALMLYNLDKGQYPVCASFASDEPRTDCWNNSVEANNLKSALSQYIQLPLDPKDSGLYKYAYSSNDGQTFKIKYYLERPSTDANPQILTGN